MTALPNRATDDDARAHMATQPGHDVTVDIDDQWICLTCEEEETEDDPEVLEVYSLDALLGTTYPHHP